jgi:hypothetical protein
MFRLTSKEAKRTITGRSFCTRFFVGMWCISVMCAWCIWILRSSFIVWIRPCRGFRSGFMRNFKIFTLFLLENCSLKLQAWDSCLLHKLSVHIYLRFELRVGLLEWWYCHSPSQFLDLSFILFLKFGHLLWHVGLEFIQQLHKWVFLANICLFGRGFLERYFVAIQLSRQVAWIKNVLLLKELSLPCETKAFFAAWVDLILIVSLLPGIVTICIRNE